jgi:hypothetical protein
MQRLFEFIGHHPFLAAGAVVAALAVIAVEIKEYLQKFAALSATQAVRFMNQGALILDLRPSRPAISGKHATCRPRNSNRRPSR